MSANTTIITVPVVSVDDLSLKVLVDIHTGNTYCADIAALQLLQQQNIVATIQTSQV